LFLHGGYLDRNDGFGGRRCNPCQVFSNLPRLLQRYAFDSILYVNFAMLREEPCLLMYSFVVAGPKPATPPYGSSFTVPKHLVRITNFSLGMLYFLIALAMSISLTPYRQPHITKPYIGVNIGSIPSLNASVPSCFEQGQRLFLVKDPSSPIWVSIRHTSENSNQPWRGRDILIFEILRPLWPSRPYFIVCLPDIASIGLLQSIRFGFVEDLA
jgi:hypothetical protein